MQDATFTKLSLKIFAKTLILPFCQKMTTNEIFLFQIKVHTNTTMSAEADGSDTFGLYNPDAWGSTTNEKGTRVSRRRGAGQLGKPIGSPPPSSPALLITDVITDSTIVPQSSGTAVCGVLSGTVSMDTNSNIAPVSKMVSPSGETNSNMSCVAHHPPGTPAGKFKSTNSQDRLLSRTPVELMFKVRRTIKYTGLLE